MNTENRKRRNLKRLPRLTTEEKLRILEDYMNGNRRSYYLKAHFLLQYSAVKNVKVPNSSLDYLMEREFPELTEQGEIGKQSCLGAKDMSRVSPSAIWGIIDGLEKSLNIN